MTNQVPLQACTSPPDRRADSLQQQSPDALPAGAEDHAAVIDHGACLDGAIRDREAVQLLAGETVQQVALADADGIEDPAAAVRIVHADGR